LQMFLLMLVILLLLSSLLVAGVLKHPTFKAMKLKDYDYRTGNFSAMGRWTRHVSKLAGSKNVVKIVLLYLVPP
jgi:hypothetical protein